MTEIPEDPIRYKQDSEKEDRTRWANLAKDDIVLKDGLNNVARSWSNMRRYLPALETSLALQLPIREHMRENSGGERDIETIGDYGFFELVIMQTHAGRELAGLLIGEIEEDVQGGKARVLDDAKELQRVTSALANAFNKEEVIEEAGENQRFFALERLGKTAGKVLFERSRTVLEHL